MESNALSACPLFSGIQQSELSAALACLQAREKAFRHGQYIFRQGDIPGELCVILHGSVTLLEEDYWGNRSIIARVLQGEVFGESFACLQEGKLPLAAVANASCRILFLNCSRIMAPCGQACGYHLQLIRNMVSIMSAKNIALTRKMRHLSRRTTQQKLLSYLSDEAIKAGGDHFDIPFDRQELADYLFVERSALSAQLSQLKRRGLLDYHKNHFALLRHAHSVPLP